MYKKKKAGTYQFFRRGGEVIVWNFKGKNKKPEPFVSLFVEMEYISQQGGMFYHLITDGKAQLIRADRCDVWDCLSNYDDEMSS